MNGAAVAATIAVVAVAAIGPGARTSTLDAVDPAPACPQLDSAEVRPAGAGGAVTERWVYGEGFVALPAGATSPPSELWQVSTAGPLEDAVGDERSIVVLDGAGPAVISLDPATGAEQWRQGDLPGGGGGGSEGDTGNIELLGPELVEVGVTDDQGQRSTTLLDRATGAVTMTFKDTAFWDVAGADGVVAVSLDGALTAFAAASGKEVWSREDGLDALDRGVSRLGEDFLASHSVTGSLGGPYLYEALDPHSGDVLWALEVPGDTLNQFVGDRLYILDQETPELSAVCVADGRELWRRVLPDIASRVLPAADDVTAVTMPGQLLGVDGSGATVWEAAVTIHDESPDVLRVDGRPLLVNATVDGIAVHDAATGQEIASTTALAGARWQPAGGVIYVLDGGQLHGLAPDTLAPMWAIDVPSDTSHVVAFDGGLVIRDDDRTVSAYGGPPG